MNQRVLSSRERKEAACILAKVTAHFVGGIHTIHFWNLHGDCINQYHGKGRPSADFLNLTYRKQSSLVFLLYLCRWLVPIQDRGKRELGIISHASRMFLIIRFTLVLTEVDIMKKMQIISTELLNGSVLESCLWQITKEVQQYALSKGVFIGVSHSPES